MVNFGSVDIPNRPRWLLFSVPRNEVVLKEWGAVEGSSLVELPSPPRGIERGVVMARDGSPLLEVVKIPSGEFLMGSSNRDKMAYYDEKPQRRIFLSEYWIARTPVTNRMWGKFLEESGYSPRGGGESGDFVSFQGEGEPLEEVLDHPVVNVSFRDAWAFCDFYGLNLPSEAQWEKAARGTDGRIWPWGNRPPRRGKSRWKQLFSSIVGGGEPLCNFGMEVGKTSPVGRYPKGMSPFGLLDCSGNVLEWCADEWSDFWLEEMPSRDPVLLGEDEECFFSLRGGSFRTPAKGVRCATRYRDDELVNLRDVGFRPAVIFEDS